jgi:hypothetical protein
MGPFLRATRLDPSNYASHSQWNFTNGAVRPLGDRPEPLRQCAILLEQEERRITPRGLSGILCVMLG